MCLGTLTSLFPSNITAELLSVVVKGHLVSSFLITKWGYKPHFQEAIIHTVYTVCSWESHKNKSNLLRKTHKKSNKPPQTHVKTPKETKSHPQNTPPPNKNPKCNDGFGYPNLVPPPWGLFWWGGVRSFVEVKTLGLKRRCLLEKIFFFLLFFSFFFSQLNFKERLKIANVIFV